MLNSPSAYSQCKKWYSSPQGGGMCTASVDTAGMDMDTQSPSCMGIRDNCPYPDLLLPENQFTSVITSASAKKSTRQPSGLGVMVDASERKSRQEAPRIF